MKRTKALLAGVLLLAGMGVTIDAATAQECTIKRFGGPTRFADKGAQTELDLQNVFKEHRADIERLLKEVGWKGNSQDLYDAVMAGAAEEVDLPKGTSFQFMMLRYKGQAQNAVAKCYGGKEPFAAWRVVVESAGYRSTFVIPKACGNVALTSAEKLPPPPPPPPPPPAPKPTPPPPPPPAPEPEPEPVAAPATVASKCRVRAFYAKAYTNENVAVEENGGTPDFVRTEATIDNGDGFGVEGECMVTPRLGIPLGLMWISTDSHVMIDTASVWEMDSESIDWFAITTGVNYHFLEPDSKFDLWAGPFLGFVSFDDASYHADTVEATTQATTVKFDDAFTWGLQVGFDVPARNGWAFFGAVRWFSLELEPTNVNDAFDFNLNPLMWNAGVSYRF